MPLQPAPNGYSQHFESSYKYLAFYHHPDGRRWWLTMCLNRNRTQKDFDCIEHRVMSVHPRTKRQAALYTLFQFVVDFEKIPYLDNTITRITIQTVIGKREDENMYPWLNTRGIEFLGLALGRHNIECIVDEDITTVVKYRPVEFYGLPPRVQLISYDQLEKIPAALSGIYQDGVFKVSLHDQIYILKEPSSPDSGEVFSLDSSSNIVRLKGIAISQNPYTTDTKSTASAFVVRGILT